MKYNFWGQMLGGAGQALVAKWGRVLDFNFILLMNSIKMINFTEKGNEDEEIIGVCQACNIHVIWELLRMGLIYIHVVPNQNVTFLCICLSECQFSISLNSFRTLEHTHINNFSPG